MPFIDYKCREFVGNNHIEKCWFRTHPQCINRETIICIDSLFCIPFFYNFQLLYLVPLQSFRRCLLFHKDFKKILSKYGTLIRNVTLSRIYNEHLLIDIKLLLRKRLYIYIVLKISNEYIKL